MLFNEDAVLGMGVGSGIILLVTFLYVIFGEHLDKWLQR